SVMDASSWSIAREAPHEFAGFACLSASRVWFRSRPPRSAEIRRSVHVALPLFSTRGTGINNNMRSSGSTHNKGYGLLRRKLELPLPQEKISANLRNQREKYSLENSSVYICTFPWRNLSQHTLRKFSYFCNEFLFIPGSGEIYDESGQVISRLFPATVHHSFHHSFELVAPSRGGKSRLRSHQSVQRK